ncbi:TRAP transporter substrate-binding protein [Azospirillum sp. SYSU D00513]|uniref:TRAP transporter substrate-binding protein n=1 Tax=Azospirillum sp. SYSU D00513 TaxID=2812561 RepID=UPI001A95E779|nr:TRAP transporter substrate-binding protein [Azospirillum sp. SYSU D00513]
MTGRGTIGTAALLGAALAAMLAFTAPAAAGEPRVRLQVASTFPSGMAVIGEGARRLAEKIERASGGELVLEIHEPGALVPAADTVKAVSAGIVDAAWAGAGWFATEDSAFNMFSSVPFGPSMGEYMAWMYRGGGLEIARAMFHARGVHNLPCALIPPEASGWFRKEIQYAEDFRGLRMRFFGLGAKVMEKFGVQTQQLPPAEILKAMQDGALDATEFSLPLMDEPFGFDTVAKYYYFPGWHQQATFFDLYIAKNRWDALSDRDRAVIELACGDTIRETIAEGEAAQGRVLRAMQDRGVQLRRWPPEILVALDEAWNEVVEEESDANPNFRRVYRSFAEFRARYSVWHGLGYLH